MFLTDLEISRVNSLIAGPMAMKHLSNELEGAKSAKTALEQAMYSREVLYVLRDHCPNYVKSETWTVVCEIIHNPDYFTGVNIKKRLIS